jgi:hypothetical protein
MEKPSTTYTWLVTLVHRAGSIAGLRREYLVTGRDAHEAEIAARREFGQGAIAGPSVCGLVSMNRRGAVA